MRKSWIAAAVAVGGLMVAGQGATQASGPLSITAPISSRRTSPGLSVGRHSG